MQTKTAYDLSLEHSPEIIKLSVKQLEVWFLIFSKLSTQDTSEINIAIDSFISTSKNTAIESSVIWNNAIEPKPSASLYFKWKEVAKVIKEKISSKKFPGHELTGKMLKELPIKYILKI